MKISRCITLMRSELELSKSELAQILCVSKSIITKWESNVRVPRREIINRLIDLCKKNQVSLTKDDFLSEYIN